VIVVGHVAVGKPVGVRLFRLRAQRPVSATIQAAYDQQQNDDENPGHQPDNDGQRLFDAERGAEDAFAAGALRTNYKKHARAR